MIGKLIRAQADRHPSASAILAPGYETLDYAGLNSAVTRVGAAMSRTGMRRVALVCSNGPEAAVAFLGIASHGVCAPLNPDYRAAEFEFYLEDLRPGAVVVEAGLESAVRGVAVALGIPVLELQKASDRAGDIELLGDSSAAPPSPDPEDVALLLHTSGTTSRPKLVPLTQANLVASAKNIAESLALTERDRCLNVMPLFHIHGLEAAVLASIGGGGSVVCCPGFVGPKFFEWMDEFRPSWYTAVPAIHQLILARAKPGERNPLRFVRSCSSALPPSLMQEMEAVLQVPVIEAYGMTEAAHQMTSNPLPPGKRKPGSVGVAAGPETGIMSDAGVLLPRGVAGEVVIRGPNVTSGYSENPEANGSAFTDGWFRTGDEGLLDEEGYLFLKGRRKEIINRGGEKIAPREIDEVLLAHPAVAQAVTFPAPHARLGETVAAAVVLRLGCETSEKILREFTGERLAVFKIPERILFLDEIPKGPTGKIQRLRLAALLGLSELGAGGARAPFVAPSSKIEKQLSAIFAETLTVERVGTRDNFFDLGGDSLLAAGLLARIEESVGFKISLLEFAEDPTVAGICNSERRESNELRVIVRPGSPALFCVPGSAGNVAGFFHLARRLNLAQPVTAFRLPPRESGSFRLEELATRYVDEVLTMQPEGPYHLAGVCTGGFVVYEMALQLAAKGHEVGVLALLDCYNESWAADLGVLARSRYRLDLLRRRLVYQRRSLRRAGMSGAARYFGSKISALFKTTRLRWVENLPIRLAAAHYVPRPWPGRLDLFRVDEPHVGAFDYPEMGWCGLAQGGIAIHDVRGSHLTMLSEPNVGQVAEPLLALLQQAAISNVAFTATKQLGREARLERRAD